MSYKARGLFRIKVALPQGIVVVEVERLRPARVVLRVQEEEDAVREVLAGLVQTLLVLAVLERQPHQILIVVVHVRHRVVEQRVIQWCEDVVGRHVFLQSWKRLCTVEDERKKKKKRRVSEIQIGQRAKKMQAIR